MNAALPNEIAGHLYQLFGTRPAQVVPLTGGFSHMAWRCVMAGEALVIKAARHEPYRAELWHEAEALIGLDRMGRGMRHARYVAFAHLHDFNVLVQKFVDGTPGIALFAGDTRGLRAAYLALARVLAVLHRNEGNALRAMQNDPPRANSFSMRNRAEYTRAQLSSLPLPRALHNALDGALAHRAWRSSTPVLVHGDAGLHNVLWQSTGRGRLAALLDWEWAGWGPALCDLAWLNWTMCWRKADVFWQATLAAYNAAFNETINPSPAGMRALQLGQIACILLRSRDNTAAYAEWLRRAEWTLTLTAG